MPLDKTEVARRQLGTALHLFLEDLDPVSVHTLACAGGEIAEHLAEKAGAQSFKQHALGINPDLDIKKLRELQRRYYIAFKHALEGDRKTERDDSEDLAYFSDEHNDHVLLIGWSDYSRAAGALPVEAQAFIGWYFAKHPDKLAPHVSPAPYLRFFPEINSAPRSEQKQRLKEAIDVRRDAIKDHPDTDPRSLVMD